MISWVFSPTLISNRNIALGRAALTTASTSMTSPLGIAFLYANRGHPDRRGTIARPDGGVNSRLPGNSAPHRRVDFPAPIANDGRTRRCGAELPGKRELTPPSGRAI